MHLFLSLLFSLHLSHSVLLFLAFFQSSLSLCQSCHCSPLFSICCIRHDWNIITGRHLQKTKRRLFVLKQCNSSQSEYKYNIKLWWDFLSVEIQVLSCSHKGKLKSLRATQVSVDEQDVVAVMIIDMMICWTCICCVTGQPVWYCDQHWHRVCSETSGNKLCSVSSEQQRPAAHLGKRVAFYWRALILIRRIFKYIYASLTPHFTGL